MDQLLATVGAIRMMHGGKSWPQTKNLQHNRAALSLQTSLYNRQHTKRQAEATTTYRKRSRQIKGGLGRRKAAHQASSSSAVVGTDQPTAAGRHSKAAARNGGKHGTSTTVASTNYSGRTASCGNNQGRRQYCTALWIFSPIWIGRRPP